MLLGQLFKGATHTHPLESIQQKPAHDFNHGIMGPPGNIS